MLVIGMVEEKREKMRNAINRCRTFLINRHWQYLFYLAVLPKRIIIGLCWTILILYSLLEFFGTRN